MFGISFDESNNVDEKFFQSFYTIFKTIKCVLLGLPKVEEFTAEALY